MSAIPTRPTSARAVPASPGSEDDVEQPPVSFSRSPGVGWAALLPPKNKAVPPSTLPNANPELPVQPPEAMGPPPVP
ncbi:MAG: hypothetical protein ACREJ3_16120, partial [Polyangiaceae bacterium]